MNLKMWSNSEIRFLRENFLINILDNYILERFLINMAATHYAFLPNISPQVKHVLILASLKIKFELLIIGCNQATILVIIFWNFTMF